MAKLLLIEDDASMLDLLRVHLTAAGHAVRATPDAAEGIRAILAETPDLILSDIGMPYLDGMELLRALRSDPVTTGVPVIFLSGRADDDTFVKARELGVDDYLTKPIQVEELLAAIDKALKKSHPSIGLSPLT